MNINRKIIYTFLVLISVLAICVVVLEIGVKIVKPQPVYSRLSELAGSFYVSSDTTDWTLKPSHIAKMPSMEIPGLIVTASINSQGFRGPEIIENVPKTIVLGDSYTFGVYVADNQTYVHQLNKLSEQNNDNMLYLNAGFTGGLETDQHYVWLKHNLLNIKPKKIIYATFPPNDIMGISPESWAEIDEFGLPVRWEKSDFAVNELGSLEYIGVNRTYLSFIHSIPILRESHLLVATFRLIDMLVSEPKDHSEDYRFLYGLEQTKFVEQEIRYLNLVAGMQDLAEMYSIDFSVVLLPINFQIEPEKKGLFFSGMERFDDLVPIYYNKLERTLKMLNIEVLNIEKAMKSSNSGPFFPANGEPHFNSNGHLFVANELYKNLKIK